MASAGKKFSYYKKLSVEGKKIYDRSDSITRIKLPHAERFKPVIAELAHALLSDDKQKTQLITQKLVGGLCRVFNAPPISVKVLARRPSHGWGEMHGLYEAEEGTQPVLTVWMRTAKRKQVVAFKTYLRTVVHEFIHHLDFTVLKLEESFHTEGFYKRESSLIRLLIDPLSADPNL